MKRLNPKLLIITLVFSMFLPVRAIHAQSVSESFNFFYNKATHLLNKNLDSAYVCATQSLGIASKKQRWAGYFLLGLVHKKKKQYHQSILLYQQAIELANEQKDKLYMYNNLANVLFEAGILDQAKEYIQKVKVYREQVKHTYLYNTYGIIAKVHSKRNNLDSAKYYFSKAVKAIPHAHKPNVMGGFLSAQGDMYARFGFANKATALHNQSLAYEKKPYKRAETYTKLAELLTKAKNYSKAKALLTLALKESKELYIQTQVLKLIAENHYQQGNQDKLKVTYTRLKALLSENRNKLLGDDRVHYFGIQDDIHAKLERLEIQKEMLMAALRHWGMLVVVLGVSALVLFVAWHRPDLLDIRFPETEQLEPKLQFVEAPTQEKGEIRAVDLKYSLKVAHIGRPNPKTKAENKDTDEMFSMLRSSSFRPPTK